MLFTDAPAVALRPVVITRRKKRRIDRRRVPLVCPCEHCQEADRFLQLKLNIVKLEFDVTPATERLRLWMLWRGVDHQVVFMLALYFEVMEAAVEQLKLEEARAQIFSAPRFAQTVNRAIDQTDGAAENQVVTDRAALTNRGGHFSADGQEQHLSDVHAKLKSIGLNDREIAVLSRIVEGNSQRETGRLCDLKKTQVRNLYLSAMNKVRDAGLSLDLLTPPAPELEYTDPVELDETYASRALC